MPEQLNPLPDVVAHRRDIDNPGWCECGHEVVFFADGDDKGETGHGCSENRRVWEDIIERIWDTWLPPEGWTFQVPIELYDIVDNALLERGVEVLKKHGA